MQVPVMPPVLGKTYRRTCSAHGKKPQGVVLSPTGTCEHISVCRSSPDKQGAWAGEGLPAPSADPHPASRSSCQSSELCLRAPDFFSLIRVSVSKMCPKGMP